MSFVEQTDGNILYDHADILDEVHNFYHELNMRRDTKDIDLGTFDAPKLSQEDSDMIEDIITEAEALAALSSTKT